ncbi:hypothetical protein F4809DRAFT_410896 [Biscogniauxia mediterranea]|nr:hypothetical protein F4809DRAFT_410896 [Biscogniauxia mediterranea]
MTGSSNQATYNGETLVKPKLKLDANGSTSSTADGQRLRSYRLSSFVNGPDSVPRASKASPSDIRSAREARIAAELDALTNRLH